MSSVRKLRSDYCVSILTLTGTVDKRLGIITLSHTITQEFKYHIFRLSFSPLINRLIHPPSLSAIPNCARVSLTRPCPYR
jgi:hypothetical protein